MGDNICMFGKSASSGVEAMNCANKLARQKTAVDVLNGVILLMKLKAERFNGTKILPWNGKTPSRKRASNSWNNASQTYEFVTIRSLLLLLSMVTERQCQSLPSMRQNSQW